MTKFLKYTLKTLGALICILLILYIVAFIYISINRKSIIKDVTNEIGKKINGNVSIGDVDLSFFKTFPRISVLLNKVSVTDTMFAKHHHPFFQSDEVYAQLSLLNLIEKKSAVNGIRIEKGSIYLFTDTSGYTNSYLLKPKKDSAVQQGLSKPQKNNLQIVDLKNVRVTEDNRQKNQLLDFSINNLYVKLKDEDAVTNFKTKLNVIVNSLGFNLANGSFIKGKKIEGDFNFKVNKKLQQLQFDSIDINIAGQPFNISAWFDLVRPDPQFSLKVYTRQIFYSFAKSLFTPKIDSALSIVTVDKRFDANADISGPLNGGDPLINAWWNVTDASLTTPFTDFDKASFTGFYTDEVAVGLPRRDPNSKIVIHNFSASWNGLPVSSSNILINNLYKPLLVCDLTSNFSLTRLNDIINSNSIQLQSGDGTLNLTYKGPIGKNNNTNSFVNGVVSFKNGNVLYVPRDVELKNVNGKLVFKNSDVFIESLQCSVLDNKFIMNGEAKNLLTLMNSEPNKAIINWNIYSPLLNLSSFTYLLKSRKKIPGSSAHKGNLNKVANRIDEALAQGSLHVNLHAARLLYKKFESSNTIADVSLLPDRYIINNVSMDNAGGHINLKGSVVLQNANEHLASVNVLMDNVDVNKIFESFNNFGQVGIQAKNLEGKLDAKVNASLKLNDEGKANPKSIESIIDFSLKNGALNNFEPVKKIQSFVFKNRDFENIRFAELKDRLEIKDQEITINKMEIQSNVLTMYVEGIYSMKGNTNMSIQIPFSNLKKRDADYNPVNEGIDKKTGPSLYIRGRPGADGTIQFKPELLHLFRKHKKFDNS